MTFNQVRFCHLELLPPFFRGDVIRRGDKIGRMGNTGKSSNPHLHMDIIQSIQTHVYRLRDISGYILDIDALMKQYSYFLVDEAFELFKIKPHITSSFGDPFYFNKGKFEFHPALDLVPVNRHSTVNNFDIFWPRSKDGKVVSVGYDEFYGYYICIAFEV